jgi:hypothetical protein
MQLHGIIHACPDSRDPTLLSNSRSLTVILSSGIFPAQIFAMMLT